MAGFSKIDKLDKKIIYLLDLNSRQSNLQIAKKLRTSREVVDYRIKRLIKNNVIRKFFTHIRAEKLGFTIYKIYFKIKGLGKEQEEELKNYFIGHSNVYRVVTCDGIYDLIVSITAKDVYQLYAMLQKCFQKYDTNFLSKDVTISTAIYHSRKEYIVGHEKDELLSLFKGGEKGALVLDYKDTEILKTLANNARTSVIEMAQRLGITSGAVIYRMKNLSKKEIISAYRCSINLEKIGYISCKVFLSLNMDNLKKLRELHQFCLQHPNIIIMIYCIGHWDFEIEFEIENTLAFHNLLKEIKIRFSDIIKNCESVILSHEYKFDHFPECYPVLVRNKNMMF